MTMTDAVRQLLAARSDGICELMATRACTGTATDWHHRQRRDHGDDSITNALHGCRTCHGWAHNHPTVAKVNGWIVPTWEQPATVPVQRQGVWVELTPDGGYTPTRRRP